MTSPFAAGRQPAPPAPPPGGRSKPKSPTGESDLPTFFDDYGGDLFGGGDENDDDEGLGRGPQTLAARAEPLDEAPTERQSGPPGGRAPGGKPGRPPSAPRGAQAARAEAARARNPNARGSKNPKNAGPKSAGPRAARNRRQPKEPSKALLAVAVVAIIGAGFGAAWYLTGRDGSDSTDTDAGLAADDTTGTSLDGETAGTDDGTAGTDQATPGSSSTTVPLDVSPVVVFDEAAFGPIEAGTEYAITVGDAPPGAMVQLMVDEQPVGEPAQQLAPATFTAGRHLLTVELTMPGGAALNTDPVLVYAIPAEAPTTFGANLASVNMDDDVEGWAEALRKFDDYMAAGHTELQLVPSEQYPSLTEGYWFLFVGGFSDAATAEAYCEEKGLTVPDECFGREFDPTAPAS